MTVLIRDSPTGKTIFSLSLLSIQNLKKKCLLRSRIFHGGFVKKIVVVLFTRV